jgi:chromosome segregation ATPase
MQRAMANGISEKAELEAELMRLREQLRSGENGRSRNVVTLQSRLSEMSQRIHDDKREIDFASEKVAQLTAELNGNRRTSERLERAKHELEEQLNQLTIQLMAERKELRSLQMENLRLENQLSEASSRLETETERSKKTENDLQKEMSKLIDSLKDEQVIQH